VGCQGVELLNSLICKLLDQLHNLLEGFEMIISYNEKVVEQMVSLQYNVMMPTPFF